MKKVLTVLLPLLLGLAVAAFGGYRYFQKTYLVMNGEIIRRDTTSLDMTEKDLAELEKVPLDKLLGSTFGGLFANMDPKWLSSYERAILYGETLEIIDYSPEIDTNLNIICFPTFRGHCGCILFDITKLKFAHEKTDTQRAMSLYFEKLLLNRPD